jgi:sec-independent protein translocase protein TatC
LFSVPFISNKKLTVSLNQSDFIFTNIFEAFSSYIFLSFISTFYLTIPIIINIWFSFFKSGLIKYEKDYLFFIINLYLLFGFFSVLFTFKIVLPMFLKFFIGFENLTKTNLFTIKLEPRILDYLNNTASCLICCTFIFQIPIALVIFLKQTFISLTILEKTRRLFLISFVILGGILSPPDIFAQLVIAIPLCFIFEFSLFLTYIKKHYDLI